MALTKSNMLPLGTIAPDFYLLDTIDHQMKSLSALKSDRATVIMFICNHCPYVIHVRDGILQLAQDYQSQGVEFIAISANDAIEYPDDHPDKMHQVAKQFHFPFPYLYDETQKVAKAYHAACTPDFFVFDGEMRCVYRGRMDGSTPGNHVPVTGQDLRHALDQMLQGKPVDPNQQPSMGCNIKWKMA